MTRDGRMRVTRHAMQWRKNEHERRIVRQAQNNLESLSISIRLVDYPGLTCLMTVVPHMRVHVLVVFTVNRLLFPAASRPWCRLT